MSTAVHFEFALASPIEGDFVSQLSAYTALSKQTIKDAMAKGAVSLQEGSKRRVIRRKPSKLLAGQIVHLFYNADILTQQPQTPRLIADEKDYSVWCKPRGMLSQGSRWGDHCSIARAASIQLDRQCSVVHRLDKSACGLILLAHNKSAAAYLSQLFQDHAISKSYRVVVTGCFPNEKQTVASAIDGKSALSHFSKLEYNAMEVAATGNSVVDVEIETGRKHQVRSHAARLGFPIVGDRLHGEGKDGDLDLQLCARTLSFPWGGSSTDVAEQRNYEVDAREFLEY